ncbi:MAG TPA: DUF1735 domain-containing protein [Puia sp.]|jgi:hypothetical protein|nr:DUF1735 domain-containing protein [Puia sp.]
MKIFKLIKPFTLTVIAGICLSSCLKDNTPPPLAGQYYSVPNLISFQDNGGSDASGAGYGTTTTPYPLYQFSLSLYNDTAGFAAIIFYGPQGNASQDITVKLAIDTAALNAFNAANFTNFVAPDPSTYTFPASVTIPKGQNQTYARITVNNNSTPDPNANYAIPLMISSVSSGTVSTNFGIEINAFSVQ